MGRTDNWRDRETVTVAEAAAILGVTVPFLYERVRAGSLGAFQVGQKWLIPTARLRALLDLPNPAA